MQLKLELSTQNAYPLQGLLVRGETVSQWLVAFDNLGIQEGKFSFYPVPSKVANVLYGCLVIGDFTEKIKNIIGTHQLLQSIENKLFIPEFTSVSPQLCEADFQTVFDEGLYILHPEVGFYQIENPIDWCDLLDFQFVEKEPKIITPLKSVYIPSVIKSAHVEVKEQDIEKKMLEMIKGDAATAEDSPFNLDKLMRGNGKEIDKLMAYFDKNPDLALRFALPLDSVGASRGSFLGNYEFKGLGLNFFNRIRKSLNSLDTIDLGRAGGFLIAFFIIRLFSASTLFDGSILPVFGYIVLIVVLIIIFSLLFAGSSGGLNYGSGNSAALLENKKFEALKKKYEQVAEEFIKKGQYHKASHIYLKLLKDTAKAGKALEAGKFYNDAASIYEKESYLKIEAARCYELAHSYQKAINIYKTYNNYEEKIGDLYQLLDKQEEAEKYYSIVLDKYEKEQKYIPASELLIRKLNRFDDGQNMLLKGWEKGKNKHQCLVAYFNNIQNQEIQILTLKDFYNFSIDISMENQFLDVLKTMFTHQDYLRETISPIAFEIITNRMEKHPGIINALAHFVPENYLLHDDISLFKLRNSLR